MSGPWRSRGRASLRTPVLAALALALITTSRGADGFADSTTTLSRSGQFVVSGPRLPATRTLRARQPGQSLRELTPQTLAVSCERVKGSILRTLAQPDAWRAAGGKTGKIFVSIDPTLRTNAPLSVEATRFENGWWFRVGVPSSTGEDRLVRALTQAVVMELASRAGNDRAGEPPLWLVEGLTQLVLAAAPDGVILQPQTRASLEILASDTEALDRVRALLSRQAPLSFHELSQPDLSRMGPRDWDHYSACAHLCVRELARLPDGRDQLAGWIAGLQRHWNWQTGFLEAWQPVFRSLLDVEKWWALTLANFTGRNAASAWSADFALRKLAEALQPAGILPGAGSRPSRLALEDVLTQWDYARQLPLLRQLLPQLHALRINSPPEVSPLVFRYIDVLDDYLAARSRAGFAPITRGEAIPTVRLITREAVGRLRELDGERARLVAGLEAPPAPTPAP